VPPSPHPPGLADLDGLTIEDRRRLGRRLSAVRRRGGSERELAELERAVERARAHRAARAAAVPALSYPEELPISARRHELAAAIAGNQVVVVAGETGSGKTTQLPKICLGIGRGVEGMIGHTQPRRIAARTVAERLSEELAVPLGGAVGYAVRFHDQVGELTLVKVMTDGILLAELRRDRLLEAYDTIIVDEAHERSLNIDFLLGYLGGLLARRPELKVVITSATIDTARFAAHFDAPVVEVSGRSYPVEVRYRPLLAEPAGGGAAGERDPGQALCEAVSELVAEGPGDVLVFLPGERDIRDAAEALEQGGPPGLELLPLYARLSAAEQHRVFRPHDRRRVVLATNVAETSLTVPGIRYVVDSGLARVSRFSHRSKVQRLPIEPVSRASADQRAGRCGRVAPGICIRLYSEQDYEARPAYTEPEILRTNLASVILQMAAIGLGEVERFPFLDPPDRRSVADGRALLEELGALEPGGGRPHITPLGRRLADLPLDPRLGRMVVEAESRGCLREVTVIAAALSIQDPRERPVEHAAAADLAHARFRVPGSDFLGFLALWDYLAGLQAELSGNQFRRRCRAEYLHVLRVREWQDVAGQVRQVYRAAGVHANSEPAPPDEVHRALLSGLLSHVGMRDRQRGDYLGARNTRWQIARGSSLSAHPPPWAMAGVLVETERSWARVLARIEPAWAEELGAHLVKRSYSEPWWDERRGEAVVEERVTLYGLPVVSGRRVAWWRHDPEGARLMFIEHALVAGEWRVDLAVLEENRRRIDQVLALEERVRRRHLFAGEDALARLYDSRLPSEVLAASSFGVWWRGEGRKDPDRLLLPLEALIDPSAGPVDLAGFPDRWSGGGVDLELRYRFEPGARDDGVTAVVPLLLLHLLRPQPFEWHVPGYRAELVAALVRALPKQLRRRLVPAAETAVAVAAAADPSEGELRHVLAARLSERAGERVEPADLDLEGLPDHLRVRFLVLGEGGAPLAASRRLEELQEALRPELRAALAAAFPGLVRRGATSWEFGDLPPVVELGPVLAYPTLVDGGDSVDVAVLESAAVQRAAMWAGTRRLLLLAVPLDEGHVARRVGNATHLALARSGRSLAALMADSAAAVADRLIAAEGGPPFTAAGFDRLCQSARRELVERAIRVAAIAGGVLGAAEAVSTRADALAAGDRAGRLDAALADVRRQLGALVAPGFVSAAGTARLRDLLRYLDAAGRRLSRLPADAQRDAGRQAAVARVEERLAELRRTLGSELSEDVAARLEALRWGIEELRVSLWAQELGTAEPVSEQRLLRAMGELEGREAG